MIFNMSTFFPTQAREYIYPSDLLTDNLQAVSAYLNERKSQRKERDKLLVSLAEYSIPDNVRKYLLGCPNESLRIAIRHLKAIKNTQSPHYSWSYFLEL